MNTAASVSLDRVVSQMYGAVVVFLTPALRSEEMIEY